MPKKPAPAKGAAKSANKPAAKKAPKNEESFYGAILKKMDDKLNLSAGDFSPAVHSTGVLCIDNAIGGGVRPGMATIEGAEGAAKSTLCIETFISGIHARVPILYYQDMENSLDSNYAYNMSGISNVLEAGTQYSSIFYSSSNSIQRIYDGLSYTLGRLPDKIYRRKSKEWFYRVEKGNKRQEMALEALTRMGNLDKQLSEKGNHLYFHTNNARVQGLFFIDSYASGISGKVIENDERNESVGQMARLYSEQLGRVVGYFRSKCVVVLGTNQIRDKPMVMFGPTQYTPGGNALKHYSNNRGQLTPRAIPEFWKDNNNKGGGVYNEPSVEFEGMSDSYMFKHYKNTKNKYSSPFKETWTRVWTADGMPKRRGRGFDKVFDTANYLCDLGHAKLGRKKGEITLDIHKDAPITLAGKSFTWTEFKVLILRETVPTAFLTDYLDNQFTKVSKDHKLKTTPSIRRECVELLNKG